MKYLLAIVFVFSAGSAWALTQEECLQSTSGGYQHYCAGLLTQPAQINPQAVWQGQQQLQMQAQIEAARQQALGLALFGSGPAMINGMNQGMQNIRVHPYVLPPAQQYQTR